MTVYSKHINKVVLIIFTLILFAGIAIAQEYNEIKPEKGDGIYSILRRYNLDPSDHFEKFIELNKNRFGENFSIRIDQTYLLPKTIPYNPETPTLQTGVFPIFGKKYERVEFKDNKLKGAVFYIVSGHGGPDPGAVGKLSGQNLCEDEYAYDIGLRLARNLLEHNATVYVIIRDPNDGIRDERILKCDKDEYCWGDHTIPLNHIARLKQRSVAINNISKSYKGIYQRTVELHLDSRSDKEKVDIFFYHHPRSNSGKQLCQIMHRTIKERYDYHRPGRGYKGHVSGRNLYTLRHADPVATYIELGNIKNARDQKRFLEVSNRQAVANWLTLGLIKDFENSKK
jgi:N-acetylmuramoyl-L-alanine amidase